MCEGSSSVLKEYLTKHKVGFIGAGNMARAIGGGLIDKGLLIPADIHVSAPSDRNLKWWRGQGSSVTHANEDLLKECDIIFLTMKPQYLKDALCTALPQLPHTAPKLFISVLAGVKTETLEKLIIPCISSARIVRVLPNTPLLVGSGCSVLCGGDTATEDDVNIVKDIFTQCGMCLNVPENIMDAAGAISGCGPAFMYLVIEALADGGVKMGLPREMAQRLAAETMKGAAQMVINGGRHPGQLKDEVCSPGGTTIAGVCALEKHGVRSAMISAVEAATIKSLEMGKNC